MPPLEVGLRCGAFRLVGNALLRTHWNNQSTGLVDDEVFELRMEPSNWGEFVFQP